MKHLSVLIKPASSLCNMRCKYCFYANVSSLREVRSYGRMKIDLMTKMIDQLFVDLEDGDELTLAFQGGEPTLAGFSYFEQLVAYVNTQAKQVAVHYVLQTNGTLINEAWCRLFAENDFLIGLSIDGHPGYHDLNRPDARGRGTFHKALATKQLFDRYGIQYNVLCVLTEQLAQEAEQVYQFLREENIDYVQFIPCLDDLDAGQKSTHALTPQRFAAFYHALLNDWLADLAQGSYRSIKLFDDIITLFTRGRATACGILGNCAVQYVIEADGSVYPCDFYVLDEYRLGYIQEQTLRELFEQPITLDFLCSRTSLPDKCAACPFQQMCRGGCKRMKDAMYVDERADYCGYQQLLAEIVPKIEEILQLLQGVST